MQLKQRMKKKNLSWIWKKCNLAVTSYLYHGVWLIHIILVKREWPILCIIAWNKVFIKPVEQCPDKFWLNLEGICRLFSNQLYYMTYNLCYYHNNKATSKESNAIQGWNGISILFCGMDMFCITMWGKGCSKKNLTDQILCSLYLGPRCSDLQNSCFYPP